MAQLLAGPATTSRTKHQIPMSPKISGTKSATKPSSQRRTMHFHKLVKMAALLLVLLVTAIQARAQNAVDGFDPNVTGPNNYAPVTVMVVQPDGKILIGGTFSSVLGVPRNHIARLNPDGTLDTAFDPNVSGDPNLYTTVYAIAVQADGKILVGGRFTSIGGQTRNGFARLEAATGLADSFDPAATGDSVSSIALQADGKILVGGSFTNIGGQARQSMARLDAATGLADSFDPNVNGSVKKVFRLTSRPKFYAVAVRSTRGWAWRSCRSPSAIRKASSSAWLALRRGSHAV